jgi:hypothetical protein
MYNKPAGCSTAAFGDPHNNKNTHDLSEISVARTEILTALLMWFRVLRRDSVKTMAQRFFEMSTATQLKTQGHITHDLNPSL